MPAYETLPLVRSTILAAVRLRGTRSPYIQPMTVRGFSSKSVAASSTPIERMKVGKSSSVLMETNIPRIAEKMQALLATCLPRIGQLSQNQAVTLSGVDYKKEIGARIRKGRDAKGWTLAHLSRATGDRLTLKRINAYETGERMPGPSEAVILAQALGLRAAYIMVLDDIQLPITEQEERMVKFWRKLPEKDRMSFYRKIEQVSHAYADTSIEDHNVERALGNVRQMANAKKKGA